MRAGSFSERFSSHPDRERGKCDPIEGGNWKFAHTRYSGKSPKYQQEDSAAACGERPSFGGVGGMRGGPLLEHIPRIREGKTEGPSRAHLRVDN